MRRDFSFGDEDANYLEASGLQWETLLVCGVRWLLLHEFPVTEGYVQRTVTLAVRIEPGYPTAPLDMAYFFPALALCSGRSIPATQAIQDIEGKGFQRWSRHRTAQNPWRPGIDCLSTHVGQISEWLLAETRRA